MPSPNPLPRIEDLLGQSKYFSTVDLAAGFWQIRMDSDAQEKTAFVAPQGLFEFRVMPFGLTKAPRGLSAPYATSRLITKSRVWTKVCFCLR